MSIDTKDTRAGLEQAQTILASGCFSELSHDLHALAKVLAAERDAALAEVERLRGRLAEVEAQRDRLGETVDALRGDLHQVAWCPGCGEVETCDEDGACSCGRDIVVFDGRGSFEVALEYIDGVKAALNRAADRIAAAEEAWTVRCNVETDADERRESEGRSCGLDEVHGILMDEAKAAGVGDAG